MDRSRLPACCAALLALCALARDVPAQTAPGQPPRAPAPSTAISAPDPHDLELLRPLLPRGAVILPRGVDDGTNGRATIYVRVEAPLALVHRVITTPEQYPTFMPAVGRVEVLSRQGRRAAFRFHVDVTPFHVTADATLHAVTDRRVDIAIPRSDFGASGSRWDLIPDGAGATIMALTLWTDPQQGNWLIRQLAGTSPWAPSGAAITAETVLALAVRRRAEILAGANLPVRPARPSERVASVAPPPRGPWMDLALTVNVIVLDLDREGRLLQATALGATSVPASSVIGRMGDVERYGDVWGWVRNGTVLERPAQNAVRFQIATGAPLAAQQGQYVRTVEPGGTTVSLRGVEGAFAGESMRWDVTPAANGALIVSLTGGSEESHMGLLHRALMDRDPWTVAGMTAYWKVVALRYGLAGLR